MNRNSILVGLVIFYSIFLGLLGIWNPSGLTTTEDNLDETEGFLGWLSSRTGFIGDVGDFLSNMFTNISGFPAIVNVVVFTPLGLMAIWLIVDLLIYITPFIGGS